jgi:hypothetical protein
LKKKQFKKCRFEKKENQIWYKNKTKLNHKGWNWKTISIKKRIRTITNINQKNEYHIWYKNKMSNDEIQRQINSINDSRPNILQLKE